MGAGKEAPMKNREAKAMSKNFEKSAISVQFLPSFHC